MKSRTKIIFRIKNILIFLALLFVVLLVVDIVRISKYEVIPMRSELKINCEQDQVYFELANGASQIDWTRLDGTLEYLAGEYDCSDFRLVNLLRMLYEFEPQISSDYKEKIEDALFHFRYWWDEPGENSMCYWSENHQILFASAEYLVGQKYPESVFPNSGLTGRQHMEKARQRILDWLKMRWNYGFTEFYSGTYYKEDIGALINLIDFAKDEAIAKKCRIAMDLLLYDLASQNIHTMFVSASGRAYEGNRKGGPGADLGGLTRYFWGDGKEIGPGIMYGMMTTRNYVLPPVLADIARDTSDVIIKQSNGLNIPELKTEDYYGTDNRSMMMQWGMECFTNPEIVRNSLSHIRSCNMFSNEFVKDFRYLDFTFLRWLHLVPVLTSVINPQPNGVAIQKGNTYTFKTKDFSMYTAQSYHPGTYGDQQHVFGLNIDNHFSIFHSHPALEKDVKHQSPNYWVGYGHLPHSVQDENINLSIYSIPKKKGLMEMDLLNYTHAYFPSAKFDTTRMEENYVFGKKDDTYCAFIGRNSFAYRDDSNDDLIQKGKKVFWITEAGSKERDGSFAEFVRRIKNNKVAFNVDDLELTYQSNGKNYELKFGEDFLVDGKVVNTDYPRYDSPYVKGNRKNKTFSFEYNGKTLFLDFDSLKRKF